MSEYYEWVNVDRKEYMLPADFDYGPKWCESRHKDSTPLLALHTLLNNEWKNCHILFFGDETSIPENTTNYTLKKLLDQMKEENSSFEMGTISDTYRDVSCLFKESEKVIKKEIEWDIRDLKAGRKCNNYYRLDINDPYKGLFTKTGRRFKYVLNDDKKVYYSIEDTKIISKDDNEIVEGVDPLPNYMCYGWKDENEIWIGDIVSVSDEKPVGYTLIDKIYLDI